MPSAHTLQCGELPPFAQFAVAPEKRLRQKVTPGMRGHEQVLAMTPVLWVWELCAALITVLGRQEPRLAVFPVLGGLQVAPPPPACLSPPFLPPTRLLPIRCGAGSVRICICWLCGESSSFDQT